MNKFIIGILSMFLLISAVSAGVIILYECDDGFLVSNPKECRENQ